MNIKVYYKLILSLKINEAKDRLNDAVQSINDLNTLVQTKKVKFKKEVEEMDDLKKDITFQIQEVCSEVSKVNDAAMYWDFSNNLSDKICLLTKDSYFESFLRWLNAWPILQLYMKGENQVHSNIYQNAHLEGSFAKLSAQLDLKHVFQSFLVDHFKYYDDEQLMSEADLSVDNTTASVAYESLQQNVVRKKNWLLLHCEKLKNEILQRENLREKLNMYTLECCNALEVDLEKNEKNVENEAKKTIKKTMEDLRYAEEKKVFGFDDGLKSKKNIVDTKKKKVKKTKKICILKKQLPLM